MTTYLHRFTVKPRHLEQYLTLWSEELEVRRRLGFGVHRAFVETDAEPKVTLVYSGGDGDPAAVLAADPQAADLAARAAPHVFRNATIRPVRVELMTEPGEAREGAGPTVIMRRYSIVGAWEEFLEIWRRIVPVRERHGFPCLFAVADEPQNMFTWAFGFAGQWADFAAAQRPYYADPERVTLRGVFDHMADYAIHPARELPIRGDSEQR